MITYKLGDIEMKFVEEEFTGSLPRFLAAFTRRNKLSDNEAKEIEDIINSNQEEWSWRAYLVLF